MKKARFLAIFFVIFALLLVLWRGTGAARWYTDGLLAVAGVMGPVLHGWVLEVPPQGTGAPTWVRGENRVRVAIQFDPLAVGLVPLLALLAATPGFSLGRRGWVMLIGGTVNFLLGALIVALFPLLVFYKNDFTDVIGTFVGVVGFVGAPAIIWFALSFRQLQEVLPLLRPRAARAR